MDKEVDNILEERKGLRRLNLHGCDGISEKSLAKLDGLSNLETLVTANREELTGDNLKTYLRTLAEKYK